MELIAIGLTFLLLAISIYFYRCDWSLPIEEQFNSWEYKVAEVFFTLALALGIVTLTIIIT